MGQALTSQWGERGRHGSPNNASSEEETCERLSSLIRQKGLTGGGGGRDEGDCYWVLLAESSRDRFVILEGIHESCWIDARNDEFQLVAVGSAATEDGCAVFWPAAKDLARVAHTIMRKKRNAANDDSDIVQEAAIRGLPICHLVGCEARFSRQSSRLYRPPWIFVGSSPPSLELEMQMLSRLLKPPSVLAAAADSPPSLFAQDSLDDTASSASAPLALVSVGMENTPSEAAGHELSPIGRSVLIINHQQLAAAAPPHFMTRSFVIALLLRHWWRDYDLQAQGHLESFMADLEAGGQAHGHGAGTLRTGGGAAAPVQEPLEAAKMLEGVMVQAYAAFLPMCVTAYPVLKDAPDHVKFTVFAGLAFITVGLFAGILSTSVACRGLAIRLVSFSAIAVLTFSVASQLSSRTYVALTALVGVALNFIIMLLPF